MTSETTVGRPTKQDGDGQTLKLLVVFERDEDGLEVASCPTLPGCHSQGRTRREALENVRESHQRLSYNYARRWCATALLL